MRKLASIRTIKALQPIIDKDRIELAIVDGWSVIVKKEEFKAGDLCVYIEIDSKLPETETFEFLRSKKFIIKTMKMGGVVSQGIIFPLSILPPRRQPYLEGEDVTEVLCIEKYEKYAENSCDSPTMTSSLWVRLLKKGMRYKYLRKLIKPLLQKDLTKKERNDFPYFIAKTDETRIQNMPQVLNDKSIEYIVREKVDGTSATFFVKRHKTLFGKDKFEFGVCSRNRRLYDKNEKLYDGSNGKDLEVHASCINSDLYWGIAHTYDLKRTMTECCIVNNYEWFGLQGEIIAPKVQGNKYKVMQPELYLFNLLTPNGKHSCECCDAFADIPFCPLVCIADHLPDTVGEVMSWSNGMSKINPEVMREGLVFRNYENNISFKAVSPEFLLKYDE